MAYDRPSSLVEQSGRTTLDLVAAGGPESVGTPFFTGWVGYPRIVAQVLLAVAAVARSTYFRPIRGGLLDPILTSGDGPLRVEAFSSCCGVYARADLLPEGLTEATVGPGTTPVDFNPEIRHALSRVDNDAELRLSVGSAGVEVVTRESASFERRVKLSTRWTKGLGEAALAQVGMVEVARLDGVATRRLLTALPPDEGPSSAPYTLAPHGSGLRFQQSRLPGAAMVAGPFRLRELTPLAAAATGLSVWSRPGDGVRPVAFQLDLPAARLWLVLSPNVARGFSGEGAGLEAMNDASAVAAAAQLRPMLDWSTRLDESALAERADVTVSRVRVLLAVLGGQGLLGRDLQTNAWFRRDLPFLVDRVAKLQPRLGKAAAIADTDIVVQPTDHGHEVFVRSGPIAHRVVIEDGSARCTCRWSVRHGSDRGPCRHILAARRVLSRSAPAS